MSLSDIMFMSTKERLSKPRLMLEGRGELWIELVLALVKPSQRFTSSWKIRACNYPPTANSISKVLKYVFNDSIPLHGHPRITRGNAERTLFSLFCYILK